MKYGIDFQFMPKGRKRPIDDGEIVGIQADDSTGTVILPLVGDHVDIMNGGEGAERASFAGRVRSRLFRYIRVGEEVHCAVNIVVEEVDPEVFGELVKE
jgi:hypothetical protein